VADPPENEGVWFAAESGPTEEGDVEETGDVMGPEVGAVGLGGCDLERKTESISMELAQTIRDMRESGTS
jgi:hypothetical protein